MKNLTGASTSLNSILSYPNDIEENQIFSLFRNEEGFPPRISISHPIQEALISQGITILAFSTEIKRNDNEGENCYAQGLR